MLKKILNSDFKNIEKYLFIISFIVISLSILTNSFIDTNGFLTTDSTHLLKLAETFTKNGNLYVYSWTNSGEINFFSMWPLGYPILISLISKVTTLDVFLASKIANIVSVFLVFYMVYKNTILGFSLIGLMLFAGSFINIFSFTLTENLFMVGLILYSYTTHNEIINPDKKNILLALIAFIIAFSSRYIGGYLLIFNFFLIVQSIRKEKGPSINLIILLLGSITYMVAYLLMNKSLTGTLTYPHAYITFESSIDIIIHFIKKLLEELNLVMASVRFNDYPSFSIISSLASLTFIYLSISYCIRNKVRHQELNRLANNFISLAIFYLIIVLLWRLTIWFSPFSYRILFPASILILFGLGYKILSRTDYNLRNLSKIYLSLILIGFLSVGYNIVYKQLSFQGISYYDNINKINEKYKRIEKGNAIVFGERHLDYLRIDLVPLKPFYLPLFKETESLEEFNKRISSFETIYMNFPEICKKPYKTLSGDRGPNCISLNKRIHSFDDQIIEYILNNNNLGLHRIGQIK